MKLAPLMICAALASMAAVDAQTLYWKADKCNTNYNNENNWEGENPITGNPGSIHLGGPDAVPVAIQMDSGMYKAGNELRLAADGLLILSSSDDGETTIQFDEAADGPAAKFIGGQDPDAEECQFGCHLNWQIETSEGFADVLQPVCSTQTAFLPEGSYHLQIPEDYNVKSIIFENFATVTKDSQTLPDFQLDIGGTLYLNSFDNCVNEGLIDATTGNCLCQTTCPTEEQLEEQIKQQRDATQKEAEKKLTELQKLSTRAYSGTVNNIDMSCLFPSTLDTLAKDQVVSELQANIGDAIKTAFGTSAASVGTLDYAPETLTLTISGTVEAEEVAFMVSVDGEFRDAWEGTWIADARVAIGYSKIEIAVIQAAVAAAGVCADSSCDAVLMTKNTTCGASCHSALMKELLDISAPKSLRSNLDKLMSSNTVANLDLADGITMDNEEKFALYQKFSGFTASDDLLAFVDQAVTCASTKESTAELLDAYPSLKSFKFDELSLFLNAGLPDADLIRLGDSLNKGPLRERIIANTVGKYSIAGFGDDFEIVLQQLVPNPQLVNRRRSIAKPHLQLTGSYMQIAQSDCDSSYVERLCPLKSDTTRMTEFLTFVNTLIATQSIILPECVTLTDGLDEACAAIAAKAAVAAKEQECGCVLSPAEAGIVAKEAYLAITLCGGMGTTPEGTCRDNSNAQEANIQAAAIQSQVVEAQSAKSDTSSEKSGDTADSDKSSGLPIIPVAAGVAGGVILILIIAVLVVRSRSKGPARATSSDMDRNVVAFENPMYDNPDKVAKDQPVYYAGENVEEDHGLYDEPSFTAANNVEKQNPLYDSAENLADMGMDGEDQGYLDVAPNM